MNSFYNQRITKQNNFSELVNDAFENEGFNRTLFICWKRAGIRRITPSLRLWLRHIIGCQTEVTPYLATPACYHFTPYNFLIH